MVTPTQPFFSVIIPTYNRSLLVKIALESVLLQSFNDFEIIVVDDGSEDNTKEVIEKYLKNIQREGLRVEAKEEKCKVAQVPTNSTNSVFKTYLIHNTHFNLYTLNSTPYTINIRYFYQKNKGPAGARNKGIDEAKGRFICFLDSDDRFRQRKLELTYNYIRKYPAYKIFHTEEIWYRKGRILGQKIYHKKPEGNVFEKALKICCISISTACVKKDIFQEVGYFDENLPVCEDYDFWLRVTAKYPVKLIPEFLTTKEGGHPDQQSKKYPALDKYRIYAIKKLLEKNGLNEKQRQMALEELKNKCNIYIQGAIKRGKTEEVAYYKNLLRRYNGELG